MRMTPISAADYSNKISELMAQHFDEVRHSETVLYEELKRRGIAKDKSADRVFHPFSTQCYALKAVDEADQAALDEAIKASIRTLHAEGKRAFAFEPAFMRWVQGVANAVAGFPIHTFPIEGRSITRDFDLDAIRKQVDDDYFRAKYGWEMNTDWKRA